MYTLVQSSSLYRVYRPFSHSSHTSWINNGAHSHIRDQHPEVREQAYTTLRYGSRHTPPWGTWAGI